MADLPASRVKACGNTFKFTGVDLFCPDITNTRYRGGRREKRHSVLFTCLQTELFTMSFRTLNQLLIL